MSQEKVLYIQVSGDIIEKECLCGLDKRNDWS